MNSHRKLLLFLIAFCMACTGKKVVEANLTGLQYLASTNPDTLRLAVQKFDIAIQHKQADHILYANKARAYIKLNKPDTALQMLDKAVELNSNYIDGIVVRAFLYEIMEDIEGANRNYLTARSLYDKELEKNDQVSFRISRSVITYYIEGKDAADSELNQILATHPGNGQAMQIKKNINDLTREQLINISLGL